MSLKTKTPSGAKGRLREYLDYKKVKKAVFYRQTGFSNGFLDKNDNIGSDSIGVIVSKYSDINISWLITGEGEMLNNHITPKKPNGDNINDYNLTVNRTVITQLIELLKKKDEQIDRLLTLLEKEIKKTWE